MALPPSIPTSFVPHANQPGRVMRSDWSGVFGIIGYGILFFMLIAAIGVFAYGRFLVASKASSDSVLAKAEAAIDPGTVQSFVQLHDRLTSAQSLLANHTAFSGFFATVSQILPKTVRLSTLHVSMDTTGATKMQGTGVAASFNALSSASAALGADGRLKDVIISKISINENNSVSFSISATLDPRIIAYTGDGVAPSTTEETDTATTTASSTSL